MLFRSFHRERYSKCVSRRCRIVHTPINHSHTLTLPLPPTLDGPFSSALTINPALTFITTLIPTLLPTPTLTRTHLASSDTRWSETASSSLRALHQSCLQNIHYIALDNVTSHSMTLNKITLSHHITSRHITSRHITSRHITSHHVTSHSIRLHQSRWYFGI